MSDVDVVAPAETIANKSRLPKKAPRRRGCLPTLIRLALSLFALALIVPLLRAGVECRIRGGGVAPELPPEPAPTAIETIKARLPGYARAEEQTFLTYPEWYIVYSADEYAAFIAKNRPSQFPYFAAISQYWNGYYDVCAITRGRYAYNDGYHLMLDVIGVSFTAENLVKGAYENTIGRLTELISTADLTEEDAYARMVARDYGALTHHVPWFEFPFVERLQGLWQLPGTGPNLVRKWERRAVLSAEYGVKALYGKAIKTATEAAYGPEDLRLQAWVKGVSPANVAKLPDAKVIHEFDGSLILSIPRYDLFTQAALDLAHSGAQFIELAGNDDVMLVAIAPRDWSYDLSAGSVLFETPVLIDPQRKRVAIKVPVKALHEVLLALDKREYRIERIYDY